MNYTNKMTGAIRQEAVGRGLIVGGIISIVGLLVLWVVGFDLGFITPIVLTLVVCAVFALLFLLLSLRRTGALKRRIRSLEEISGPIEQDRIKSLSPDTAAGNEWLVSRKGTKYKLWTRSMIRRITMNSSNPRAKKAVMEITAGNSAFPDKIIVTKTDDLSTKIAEWSTPEEVI